MFHSWYEVVPCQKHYACIPAGRGIIKGTGHLPCRAGTGILNANREVIRAGRGIENSIPRGDILKEKLAAYGWYSGLFCLETRSEGICIGKDPDVQVTGFIQLRSDGPLDGNLVPRRIILVPVLQEIFCNRDQ